MKLKDFYVNHTDEKVAAAIAETDNFIAEAGLTGKGALHLRLLAEETLGMVRAMTGDFNALFSIEDRAPEYRIILTVKTDMDMDKKQELLSASSTGKNAAAKGFMGKVRDIIENGLLNFESVMKLQQEYGGFADYDNMGSDMPGGMAISERQYLWSLMDYRFALSDGTEENTPDKEAWDELEKSIVANLAKNVTVGIHKDRVDMTIFWENKS